MNTNLLKIISIEPCNEEKRQSHSKQNNYVYCQHLNGTQRRDIQIYLINLDPLMIGKTFLELGNGNHNNNHSRRQVIISSPRRFVDKFLTIYIVCFSVIIAMLMGVMMDWYITLLYKTGTVYGWSNGQFDEPV